MAKVVHFEIPADDLKRCSKFYSEVFGWKITQWGKQEYMMIEAGPKSEQGINGGIGPRKGVFAKKGGASAFVCTIQIKDIEKTAGDIKKAGGKWADKGGLIHGVGFQQFFYDTEGNLFSCLEPDTKATTVPA